MIMSQSRSWFRRVACGLLALSIFSGGALADDNAAPVPHWSGLPIWGAEAAARGYQLPLPFGVGVTAYSARQPVDIHDLQLGRNPNPPVSVTNFLQINRVDTSQKNASAKIDVLILPFLDVYALLGYTKGTTKGLFPGIRSWGSSNLRCCSSMPRSEVRPMVQASRHKAGPRSAIGGI